MQLLGWEQEYFLIDDALALSDQISNVQVEHY